MSNLETTRDVHFGEFLECFLFNRIFGENEIVQVGASEWRLLTDPVIHHIDHDEAMSLSTDSYMN